jgi:hypothetical protein
LRTDQQGIARDRQTGHLLIADDRGQDPEGVAIRPGTSMLYLVFERGARVAGIVVVPTAGAGLAPPRPGADGCSISALQNRARPV